MGILSCVPYGLLGPFAWVKGRNLRLDALAAGHPEPTTSKIGRIPGMAATILMALSAVEPTVFGYLDVPNLDIFAE